MGRHVNEMAGVRNQRRKAVAACEPNDAHRMIEAFMITANVCAAEFLERAGVPGLYRIHEPPKADRVEQLRQAFA